MVAPRTCVGGQQGGQGVALELVAAIGQAFVQAQGLARVQPMVVVKTHRRVERDQAAHFPSTRGYLHSQCSGFGLGNGAY